MRQNVNDVRENLNISADGVGPHVSARWESRPDQNQSIDDFIREHYPAWLGQGLTISIVKSLDPRPETF